MEFSENPLRKPSRTVGGARIGAISEMEVRESKSTSSTSEMEVRESKSTSSTQLIDGVSPGFTVLCFLTASIPPLISQLIYIFSHENNKTFYGEFCAYMLAPLSAACSILAHFCQPRNDERSHFICLHLFSTVASFVNETLGMVGSGLISKDQFLKDLPSRVMLLLGWQVLFVFARIARKRSRNLPDRQLNDFLIKNLMVEGFSGLGPIIFLTFDTVRCANEVFSETNSLEAIELSCRRTLLAQLFLGGFLGIYIMARLFIATVPIGIVKKHYISVYELATFRTLSKEKLGFIFFGLLILISVMYLVGNVGAESSMSHANETLTFAIGFIGLGAIFAIIIVFWKVSNPDPYTAATSELKQKQQIPHLHHNLGIVCPPPPFPPERSLCSRPALRSPKGHQRGRSRGKYKKKC